MDILREKQGVHSYAYKNIDEAAAIIAELLENDALRAKITERTIGRAPIIEQFSSIRAYSHAIKVLTRLQH